MAEPHTDHGALTPCECNSEYVKAFELESLYPLGDYYECLQCDDGWDFVGDGPFPCPHCGALLNGLEGRDDD